MEKHYSESSEVSVKYSSGDFEYATYYVEHDHPPELVDLTEYYNDFPSFGADSEYDLRYEHIKNRVLNIIIEVAETLLKTINSLDVTDDYLIAVDVEGAFAHICNGENLPIEKLIIYEHLEDLLSTYKVN